MWLSFVGGAGSSFVAEGVRLVDTPGFNDEWKPEALAHAEAPNPRTASRAPPAARAPPATRAPPAGG